MIGPAMSRPKSSAARQELKEFRNDAVSPTSHHGIRGRGAYADRSEANRTGRNPKPRITTSDLERIRREIAMERA